MCYDDREPLRPYVFEKDGKAMFVKIPIQYYKEISEDINKYLEDQPEKEKLYEVHAYDHTLITYKLNGLYDFAADKDMNKLRESGFKFRDTFTQEEINQANKIAKGIDFNYFKREVE